MEYIDSLGKAIIMFSKGLEEGDIRNILIQDDLSSSDISKLFKAIRTDELLKVTDSSILSALSKTSYVFGKHTIFIQKDYLTGMSTEKTSLILDQIETVSSTQDLSGSHLIIGQKGKDPIKIENLSAKDVERIQKLYTYIMESQEEK